jgi:hypothetical protein
MKGSSDLVIPASLLHLDQRLTRRFSSQSEAPDLLPSHDVDLAGLSQQIVEKPPYAPKARRSDMVAQKRMLSKSFSGRSELELLHALVISYLRRSTPHTSKAWALFRRIWEEQPDFMIDNLTPRWLISALQTFYDHGDDSGEKLAGIGGFFYGNLIKIYETEHNARRRNRVPQIQNYKNKSVPGMFGFKPGDDILININSMALDVAKNGGLAARPFLALLEAVATSNTIFQRTDALHEIEPFSQHPTFTLSFLGRAP